MTQKVLITKKKEVASEMLKKYDFVRSNKLLGVVKISNQEVLGKLIDWFPTLPVNFLIISDFEVTEYTNIKKIQDISESEVDGLDFIICDKEIDKLDVFYKKGVVPIIENKNYLSSILSEFNPIKNEWNSFIYSDLNEWNIFYALIRYMENSKFSFDNKNLIHNVSEI